MQQARAMGWPGRTKWALAPCAPLLPTCSANSASPTHTPTQLPPIPHHRRQSPLSLCPSRSKHDSREPRTPTWPSKGAPAPLTPLIAVCFALAPIPPFGPTHISHNKRNHPMVPHAGEFAMVECCLQPAFAPPLSPPCNRPPGRNASAMMKPVGIGSVRIGHLVHGLLYPISLPPSPIRSLVAPPATPIQRLCRPSPFGRYRFLRHGPYHLALSIDPARRPMVTRSQR